MIKLGIIGLGKMDLNMIKKLLQGQHDVVVLDTNDQTIQKKVAPVLRVVCKL